MAPKKAAAKAAPAADVDFKTGDTVLAKVKGYPDWPGKVVPHDSASSAVIKQKGNKSLLVRFFPDGDYHWATPRELKPLTTKTIDAFLSDSGKKSGKLRQGYEIAKDPTEWEDQVAKGIIGGAGGDDEEDEDEDIDQLGEDGEAKPKAGSKRKRAAATEKKDNKKKPKETAAKKRKTDEKPKSAKETKAAATKDAKKSADDDQSEGSKTVKGWRATLQKAFLTSGVPAADKMPEYDAIFKRMEGFEMQTEWLTASKLVKVLKKMSQLGEIPREDEFKLKERSTALVEKWRELIVKEGGEEAGADAEKGDVTMAAPEEEKKEADKAPAAEEKKETNGHAEAEAPAADKAEEKTEGVNHPEQTNGTAEPAYATA